MLERLADYDDALMEQLLGDIEPPRDLVFDDLAHELRGAAQQMKQAESDEEIKAAAATLGRAIGKYGPDDWLSDVPVLQDRADAALDSTAAPKSLDGYSDVTKGTQFEYWGRRAELLALGKLPPNYVPITTGPDNQVLLPKLTPKAQPASKPAEPPSAPDPASAPDKAASAEPAKEEKAKDDQAKDDKAKEAAADPAKGDKADQAKDDKAKADKAADLQEVPPEVVKQKIRTELERNQIKAVAFVGGAADEETHVLKKNVEDFEKSNPGVEVKYFHCTDGAGLQHWLEEQNKATGNHVAVIGHSWGGDTAASRVADGTPVKLLVTFDPVSRNPPDFKDVKKNSETWLNINATGHSLSFSQIVAGFGGGWDDGPAPVASYHYRVGINHGDCSQAIPTEKFHHG